MKGKFKAIVIGASAGALDALSSILPQLPAEFPLPIMVVVHLPPDKESILAQLLSKKCKLQVKEAEDKEKIKPGTIYVAPPDYHMLIENDKHISLSSEEPVLFSRPSIDVLFETASDVYEDSLIGVVLTGGNNDGTNGLKTIISLGGTAIVQQPDSAYATAMPEAAIKACPEAHILSLEQIVIFLKKAAL